MLSDASNENIRTTYGVKSIVYHNCNVMLALVKLLNVLWYWKYWQGRQTCAVISAALNMSTIVR